jgi:hypothetical protein
MASTTRRTDRVHYAASAGSGLNDRRRIQTLKVGDRVCWSETVTEDDGHATSILHNDMAQVELVPKKMM